MKILLSNAVVSHGAFHHWMTADLRAMGHEVSTLDPDELCEQFGIELYRRVLLQRIASDKPDIFIVYPPYDLLREEERKAIHESGTAIVGFAYDDPIFLPSYTRTKGDFEKIAAEFNKTYDVYFTTSRDMVKQATDRDIHFMKHIRWACVTPTDPGDTVRDLPLVVIGAPYPRRVNMVKHLKAAGVKPIVFGAEGWKQFLDVADCYNGMLTRPGMFEMYKRAKIALAPADWESNYTPMVKLRSLEIASMGPLQIIEQCEDLFDYFEDDKEVVSYRAHDWDQLAELIKQYLNDDAKRSTIARAGYERLVRDHVWKVRWQEIEDAARPKLEKIRHKPMIAVKESEAHPTTAPANDSSEIVSVPKGAYDPHLAQELGLSACAMHYEKLGDINTALIAVEEWLAVRPNYYANLLTKARLLFHQKTYAESETYFLRALEVGKGLCNIGVDITVTQRKLGPRLGLGRLFSGIFPRHLECYSHLLMIYAATDQVQKAEDLMTSISVSQDHLFVSIVAIIAESGLEGLLSAKFLARYIEVLLSLEPIVWAGEKKRHRAHFWMLRGQAIANLGNREEGRDCLAYALSQDPYPQVEQQIRKQLALVG